MSARDEIAAVLEDAAAVGWTSPGDIADAVLAWLGTALADEGLREAMARAIESDWENPDYWAPADAALAVIRERLGVES